jgi:hypothetical protein
MNNGEAGHFSVIFAEINLESDIMQRMTKYLLRAKNYHLLITLYSYIYLSLSLTVCQPLLANLGS